MTWDALSPQQRADITDYCLQESRQLCCGHAFSDLSSAEQQAIGGGLRFAAYTAAAKALVLRGARVQLPAALTHAISTAFGASSTGFKVKKPRQE